VLIIWLIGGLLAIPLLCWLALRLFPAPILRSLQRSASRSMDIENFNASGRYSHFGFRPVHHELSGERLAVEGEIPEDLQGIYIRNGTNSQFRDTKSPHHVFNGAGMLHSVQFKDGEVRYTNTYIRTPRFDAESKAGEEIYTEFGALVGTGKAGMKMVIWDMLRQKLGLSPKLGKFEDGTSTTALMHHAGKLYALQETLRPFGLNTKVEDGWLILDGSGKWERFGGKLNAPYTAHPKIDPVTGDIYAIGTDFRSGDVNFSRLSGGKLVDYERLYCAKPAIGFVHDYYLTENYFIFPEGSILFEPKMLLKPPASVFHFDPDKPLRFGLIMRDRNAANNSDPVWFETLMPGHIWHTINGWEEIGPDGRREVVLVAPVFTEYPSTIPIHTVEEPHAQLYKFRLDLDTQRVVEEKKLLDHFYERPSMNWAYLGTGNRFAYLLDEGKTGIMGAGTLKYDIQAEEPLDYFDFEGAYGGEALFVAKAGAKEEDDGYLIDILMREDSAELTILDAKKMDAVARIKLPQRVPFGVHALWLDEPTIRSLT